MTEDGRNSEKELLDSIEKFYGFKRELIKNPEQCGLWHVRFEVNGIKYYGAVSFYGAAPTLRVEGYVTEHYEHETPVEDWYYDEFIKGRPVKILKAVDKESGDWEDTGIRFNSQKEAQEYIDRKPEPTDYRYDIVCD